MNTDGQAPSMVLKVPQFQLSVSALQIAAAHLIFSDSAANRPIGYCAVN